MTVDPKLLGALTPLTSRVRTDATAVKQPDGSSRWTREPLNRDRLEHHLNGGPARGVCPIKAGEDVTMVGLLDFDSHKGEITWEQMAQVVGRVAAVLERMGMRPMLFRSSGGKGVHLYVMWDEPQDAYSVRMLLTDALAECNLKNGAKGVKFGQVEIFPKQDSVEADGFGNQFILPLANQSVPLELQATEALW